MFISRWNLYFLNLTCNPENFLPLFILHDKADLYCKVWVALIKLWIEILVSIYSNFHEAFKLNDYLERSGIWKIWNKASYFCLLPLHPSIFLCCSMLCFWISSPLSYQTSSLFYWTLRSLAFLCYRDPFFYLFSLFLNLLYINMRDVIYNSWNNTLTNILNCKNKHTYNLVARLTESGFHTN